MSEKTGRSGTLRSNQNRALEMLIIGSSQAEAAAAAGVTSRTVRRWMAEPAFSEALAEGRRQARENAANRFYAMLERIQTVLLAIVEDEELSARERTRAASVLITGTARLAIDEELREIFERLEKLEAKNNE